MAHDLNLTEPRNVRKDLQKEFRDLKELFMSEDGVSADTGYESEGESRVPKGRNSVTSKMMEPLLLTAVKTHLNKHLLQVTLTTPLKVLPLFAV